MGAAGQGPGHSGACVLVLGEHVAARVGRCTGQQRGCDVLHAPLMSFLGQARPRGKLISKQAAERSPCSPLPLRLWPPPPLPALRRIALLLMFCPFCFSLPLLTSGWFFFSPLRPASCRYGRFSTPAPGPNRPTRGSRWMNAPAVA